jgi:hypothetical protein
VSLVHPLRHTNSFGSQIGAAVPQSEFDRHATHRLLPRKHRGVLAPQSAFEAHWMHCCVVVSQMRADAGQSAAVLQPTHAPVLVSQIDCRPPPPPHDALVVHAAWHA